MKQKVFEHMASINTYTLLIDRKNINQYRIVKHMNSIVKRITRTLDNLLYDQLITYSQFQEMEVNRSKVQLDYLYFYLVNAKYILLLIYFSLLLSVSIFQYRKMFHFVQ